MQKIELVGIERALNGIDYAEWISAISVALSDLPPLSGGLRLSEPESDFVVSHLC